MTISEFMKKRPGPFVYFTTYPLLYLPMLYPITAAHEPIPSATSTVIVFTVSMTSFPNSGDS